MKKLLKSKFVLFILMVALIASSITVFAISNSPPMAYVWSGYEWVLVEVGEEWIRTKESRLCERADFTMEILYKRINESMKLETRWRAYSFPESWAIETVISCRDSCCADCEYQPIEPFSSFSTCRYCRGLATDRFLPGSWVRTNNSRLCPTHAHCLQVEYIALDIIESFCGDCRRTSHHSIRRQMWRCHFV